MDHARYRVRVQSPPRPEMTNTHGIDLAFVELKRVESLTGGPGGWGSNPRPRDYEFVYLASITPFAVHHGVIGHSLHGLSGQR
jgi:hypothetical protein